MFTIAVFTSANAATMKSTQTLLLGETEVKINIYENTGAQITFFAPHFNERIALQTAKEYVEKKGGRLIEIESLNDKGKASRYLKFKFDGKDYSIDPNRIYTENGRNCGVSYEINAVVKNFADNLLQIIFAADGKNLREGENFVVAVHNNTDFAAKTKEEKLNDLTAHAFLKTSDTESLTHGSFEEQAEGVYLSNEEEDADNFVFLSNAKYVSHFATLGFNIVIQKSAKRLQTKKCSLDDGSLSVYSALNSIQYICLEADAISGAFRQKQMFEAVYAILQESKPDESKLLANKN
jgi:hypothetical protein